MAQLKNNPIALDNTTKLFGQRNGVPGEIIPGFLGVHNFLQVQHTEPLGTTGGSLTAGAWRTRKLNSVIKNTISGASLASNQITLPVGTYFILGSCLGYGIGSHSARLYDVSNFDVILVGFMCFSRVNCYVENMTTVSGSFDVSATTSFELQHACTETSAYGCGTAGINSVGQDYNVFADVKIWKLS